MKKTQLLFAFVFPLVFSSCSKEDGEKSLSLSANSVSLYTDVTEQISASEQVSWSSNDEFVASVDKNGVIKGNHVGETTVVAKGNKGEAVCKVGIKAKYNTFTEPIFEFGANKSVIKSKEKRSINIEKEDALLFNPDNNTIKGAAYLFENGVMTGAAIYVKLPYSLEATKFLIERYLVVGSGSGDIVGAMINNLPGKATIAIGITVESDYSLILYMPYNKNKSRNVIEEEYIIEKLKTLYGIR